MNKKNLFTACHGTFYRKKLFTSVNFFIHLNLSISLLLALAVFVFGIETATASHVSVQKMNVVYSTGTIFSCIIICCGACV